MSRCPKCKKEIDYLFSDEAVWARYEARVEGNDLEYGEMKEIVDVYDDRAQQFICPECNETLFENQEEAINFLKGSD